MVENIEIIRKEMEKQHKGLLWMASKLQMSSTAISNCRSGGNCTIDTLEAVAHELGYKIVIVRDETITPDERVRKKRAPKKRTNKRPVPVRKGWNID